MALSYTLDKAGNVSTTSVQVVSKDNTVPSTASLTVGTVGETRIAVTARGTDSTSGVSSYAFQISSTSATSGFTTVATQKSTATSYAYTYDDLSDNTTYYLRVIVTDIAGNQTTSAVASSKTTISPNGVENVLKEGDWVKYPAEQGNLDCVVLYDSSSEYGVEIITMESVEDITLGVNDQTATGSDNYTKVKNSYNNAINTLNNATSKYNNSTYSDKVRCVGSDPSNPTADNPGYFTSSRSYMSNYNGQFKRDDSSSTDSKQLTALEIKAINEDYWLAGCQVTSYETDTNFYLRFVDGFSHLNGTVRYSKCFDVKSDGTTNMYSPTSGLRPVFHLRPKVKVTGGSGTSNDPYILGI